MNACATCGAEGGEIMTGPHKGQTAIFHRAGCEVERLRAERDGLVVEVGRLNSHLRKAEAILLKVDKLRQAPEKSASAVLLEGHVHKMLDDWLRTRQPKPDDE